MGRRKAKELLRKMIVSMCAYNQVNIFDHKLKDYSFKAAKLVVDYADDKNNQAIVLNFFENNIDLTADNHLSLIATGEEDEWKFYGYPDKEGWSELNELLDDFFHKLHDVLE